ncbi:MAG: extracellular solute-binding protein [Hyphomicrobium sp.]
MRLKLMLNGHAPFWPTAFLAFALLSCTLPAAAEEAGTKAQCKHAISLVGTPKMPADFKNFDWVNPDAPKGGTLKLSEEGTFDSLNAFTIKGTAAEGLGNIYDSLFAASPDEPSTEYGLVAECLSHPDDFSSVTFKLRETARFQDGKPIRPEDVIFSLEAVKAANPQAALYYQNVVKGEKTGEHDVTFTFDMKGNRELPVITSQISIVPEHYWKGQTAAGEPRDVAKSSLEVPLGSGPYKIKSFETGRNIVYERDPNYWAKDLPVAKGQYNFDIIRYEYFRDRVPSFEAFKSGSIDVWVENRASAWATQYDFDAVKKGLIKKELLPHGRVAGMQGFAMNLRRKQFQDPRVRQAFSLALDFEEMNKKLFYGAYTRLPSYFANSELASRGLPEGKELEILNEVKSEVPPEVFTTEWKNPVNTTPADFYKRLGEAVKLLQAAGWTLNGGVLSNSAGEKLTVEFLLVQPDFERVVLPYIEALKKIGINATARLVDSSQYERRFKSFDFDIVIHSIGQSHSPGNEQRYFFGSASADREGGANVIGIKNTAIDKLIDRVIAAKDRDELVAATRALDRVLLWNFYIVPNWYQPADRIASWDIFGRPEKLPSQSPVRHVQTWWYDAAKAKAAEAGRSK